MKLIKISDSAHKTIMALKKAKEKKLGRNVVVSEIIDEKFCGGNVK